MKQLLIVGSATVPSDLTTLTTSGVLTFTDLKVDTTSGKHSVLTNKAATNFAIYLGRGANLLPFQVPEVDVKTMTAVKTPYSAGNTFKCAFTIPSSISANSTRCQNLTILITKKGTVFNERNAWHFTKVLGKGEAVASSSAKYTAAQIAQYFVDQINVAGERLGLTASISSATITLVGPDNESDYSVQFIDDLVITALTQDIFANAGTAGKYCPAVPAVGDAAYVKKLYQECVEDKGVKYLAEDGKEIYPGYPEAISGTFNIFTIRFAVGRDSAKTRDERVSQIVHIAVPISSTTYNNVTNNIEYVLGITPKPAGGNG